MKTLTGFTIWEIIVVMVISSVVITLAVSVYFKIQFYFHSETKNNASGIEFMLLNDLMKKDFDKARIIQNQDNILYLTGDKSPVIYQFHEKFVIREESQLRDTFRIKADGLTIRVLAENDELVNKVEFQVLLKDFKIPFCYVKEYEKQVLYQTDKPDEYKPE